MRKTTTKRTQLNSSKVSPKLYNKIANLVTDAIFGDLEEQMNDIMSLVSNELKNDPEYNEAWMGLYDVRFSGSMTRSDMVPDIEDRINKALDELSAAWFDFYLYRANDELDATRRINSSRRRSRLNSSVAYKIIDKRHQTPGAESGFVIPESDLYRELDKIARKQYGYNDEREIRQFMFDVTDGIHPDFVLKETTLRDEEPDIYYN